MLIGGGGREAVHRAGQPAGGESQRVPGVAEAYGPRMTLIAGGVISMAATVVMTYVLARHRRVQIRSYLRPAELARMAA